MLNFLKAEFLKRNMIRVSINVPDRLSIVMMANSLDPWFISHQLKKYIFDIRNG